MYLGDDILGVIGKSGGNQRILADLVMKNGDDFTEAVLTTSVLDDFCDLAWKYGDNASQLLLSGDDMVKYINNLDTLTAERLAEINATNEHLAEWSELINNNNGLSYKNANIFAINPNNPSKLGQNLGELDEVDFAKKIIYEDKSATGIYVKNPSQPITEAEWVNKQIYDNTKKRLLPSITRTLQ